jgi:tRNA pseudouridine55 synthase
MMKYLGKSMQVPPMYSAIKVNGKKLYEYAREGKTIELLPRPIEIYSLDVLSVDMDTLDVRFGVVCSKGTYIRSLIRDIGNDLGTGATMSKLLRDEVNGIRYEDGYKISDLQKLKEIDRLGTSVLPMDEILKDTPAVNINPSGEKYLDNGNRLMKDDFDIQGEANIYTLNASQFFRVYSEGKLKALYVYDNEKNDYKVYKML